MHKKIIIFFLVFLTYFIKPIEIYGAEKKIILLISSKSSWNEWMNSSLISSLISKSSIGSMNIRTNHKNNKIEYYGTINAGRRWSYYDINDMGAVEKGLGDLLDQSNFSTAFFSNNQDLKKLIENSLGMTTYTSNDFEELFSKDNSIILNNADVMLIEMDLYNTSENQRFLLDYINQNHVLLYTFCPYDIKGNSDLTPFLFYDSQTPQQGLVSGYTTRRQGIITNLDIAPTILNQLGIDNRSMFNKGIRFHPREDAFLIVSKQLDNIYYLNTFRSPIIKAYNFFLIALLVLFYFSDKLNNLFLSKIVNSIILSTLWIPILFMLNFNNNLYFLISFCIIFFSIVGIDFYFSSYKKALIISSATILIVLTVDIFLGATLMQNSFLGYDTVIGARFYGIGNEYAGILIGNLYLFIYSISKFRYYKTISLILQFLLVVLLGMSFWGANFGGMLSVLCGLILFWIQCNQNKQSNFIYYVIVITILGFIATWLIIDSFFVEKQSHLGQTLFQFIDGNYYLLIEVLQRKVLMNLQLIKYSLWSKFLLICLVILGIYFDIDNPILKEIGPPIMGAMTGGVLFNDSGIIMVATCIIYLVFPYLYVYNQDK